METKTQTAVEYLYEMLECMIPRTILYSIDKKIYFQQAKAMEKQQIIDAVNLPKEERWYDAKLYNSSGEQYYNETFEQ